MKRELWLFPVCYFISATVIQFFQGEMRWVDSVAVASLTFVFTLIWEWAKVPHRYGEEKIAK